MEANGADPAGALRVGPELLVPGLPDGSLSGTTFVAKDVFDVAGHRTGAGNPTWLEETQPAEAHAVAVARLVEAGADLIGKAHTGELAYGIAGTNVHYGTPRNTAAPGRLPGGSSSGPAAAVAAGTAAIGLGTDTGGSIRVPASYCGLVGLRPTHGRVPAGGTVPLAPSFDTAGLLTRDGTVARRAAAALLDPFPDGPPPVSRLLICGDAADLLDRSAAEPWRAAVEALADKTGLTLGMAEIARDLEPWRAAFTALQGAEAWAAHGSWITRTEPELATDVADRFRAASLVTAGQFAAAQPVRELARRRTRQLLAPGTALVLPSACGPPPPVDVGGGELLDVRLRTLRLTCVAGLAGLPALSLPLAEVGGLPLGVCLVAPRGGDETLLDIAAAVLP